MVILLTLLTLLRLLPSPAHSACEQLHFNADQNVRTNTIITNCSFSSVNVVSVFDCFIVCHKHCRCRSFNYNGTYWSAGLCQLNDGDSYDGGELLTRMDGWLFYDLDRQITIDCSKSTFSCCSTSQPCENGGTCKTKCDIIGRRYQCMCPYAYIGERCEKKNNDP